MVTYYRAGYLIQGMWPRGLLVAAYCRGGYQYRVCGPRVAGGCILQRKLSSPGHAA